MHSHLHLNLKILWDKNLTFSLENNETEPEGKFPAQGHKATMTFKSKPSLPPAATSCGGPDVSSVKLPMNGEANIVVYHLEKEC